MNQALEISPTPETTQGFQPTAAPGRTTLPRNTPTEHPTPLPPSQTPVPSETTSPTMAQTSNLPDSSQYTWQVAASGLNMPVGVENAGDGSQRLFILEQSGRIQILQDKALLPSPFLDITQVVGSQGFEQGLLGLAFHPQYSQNGYFFLNYTDLNGDTVISRFQVTGADPDQADPASEARLLQVAQPYRNHNGGGLAFGPDGYLYIGLGDGGSAGDPENNAQSLGNLLGKLLRIDVDQGELYGIPEDNPFSDGQAAPEIWAYGLRNPWRFSFDQVNGDLYIGDVGQSQWEEIDFLPAGSAGGTNFGWRFFEGFQPYQAAPPPDMVFTEPVAVYGHDLGCSVTGGVVYRGASMPEWQSVYFYGDYCSQRIWGLRRELTGEWTSAVIFEGLGSITSFGEDESGEVYLVTHGGEVRTLVRR